MPRPISYLIGDTFRALQQERAALSARDHAILRSQIAIGAHSSQEWYDNSGARIGVERALTIVATMTRVAHE